MTTPEFPLDHIPPLDQVTGAYVQVLDHNQQDAGYGVGFKNLSMALLAEGETDPRNEDQPTHQRRNEVLAGAAIKGSMQSELQQLLQEDVFTRIGIRLAPIGANYTSTTGERTGAPELLPVLENTPLYTDFLAQQTRIGVQKSPDNIKLFADVVKTLQKNVAICYSDKVKGMPADYRQMLEQHAEGSLRAFTQIDDHYQRLGLDDAAHYELSGEYKKMQDYVTYWGRNVLPEFIAVGPAENMQASMVGYLDGGHDKLVAKVDYIVALTSTERTHDFGVESATALLDGFAVTIQQMDNNQGEWYSSDRNREFFGTLADKLRAVTNV